MAGSGASLLRYRAGMSLPRTPRLPSSAPAVTSREITGTTGVPHGATVNPHGTSPAARRRVLVILGPVIYCQSHARSELVHDS